MPTNIQEQAIQTFEIVKQEEIAAPIGIVFETILEQMGPLNSTPERPMPMRLEAWPGGRRRLGRGEFGADLRPRRWRRRQCRERVRPARRDAAAHCRRGRQ